MLDEYKISSGGDQPESDKPDTTSTEAQPTKPSMGNKYNPKEDVQTILDRLGYEEPGVMAAVFRLVTQALSADTLTDSGISLEAESIFFRTQPARDLLHQYRDVSNEVEDAGDSEPYSQESDRLSTFLEDAGVYDGSEPTDFFNGRCVTRNQRRL
jgi:hypothetical protein